MRGTGNTGGNITPFPDEKDLKGRTQRTAEIVAVVAASVGVVVSFAYGKMQAVPAFREAVAEEKQALNRLVKASDKRKKELGQKKGPDGPEVEAARGEHTQAEERKTSAMMRLAASGGAGLLLGIWGFLTGLVVLLKGKYRGGKFFKTLTKSVFAILALVVGFASLYLGVGLIWAMS